MDERELIARLQKRDEAAFEELIRQYEKKVYPDKDTYWYGVSFESCMGKIAQEAAEL